VVGICQIMFRLLCSS